MAAAHAQELFTASKQILLSLHLLQETPKDAPVAPQSCLLGEFNRHRKTRLAEFFMSRDLYAVILHVILDSYGQDKDMSLHSVILKCRHVGNLNR